MFRCLILLVFYCSIVPLYFQSSSSPNSLSLSWLPHSLETAIYPSLNTISIPIGVESNNLQKSLILGKKLRPLRYGDQYRTRWIGSIEGQFELIVEIRTLFVSSVGLENAKKLISSYKQGQLKSMTPELWHAKKIVDSTLHPGPF